MWPMRGLLPTAVCAEVQFPSCSNCEVQQSYRPSTTANQEFIVQPCRGATLTGLLLLLLCVCVCVCVCVFVCLSIWMCSPQTQRRRLTQIDGCGTSHGIAYLNTFEDG